MHRLIFKLEIINFSKFVDFQADVCNLLMNNKDKYS